MSRVKSHDGVLRELMTRHVAAELGVPELAQALDDADTTAFWERVSNMADDCLNDASGEACRG